MDINMGKYIPLLLVIIPSISAVGNTDFYTFITGVQWLSYRKDIFPRDTQTDVINVDLSYSLIAITDFNEVAARIDIVGVLVASWTNEKLTWTTASYPITEMLIPQNNFWKPPLVIPNSVETLKEIGDSSYNIRMDNYGNMEWTIGLISKTACAVDVTFYPFDSQECEIIITPWGYTSDKVVLTASTSTIDQTFYQENVEWTLEKTSVEATTKNGISYLTFKIKIMRRPLYFLVNMVIPILILGLLNGLVFILPASSGERVGYAVTAFLTFAVFLTMVSDNLPKTSNPMSLLSYFLILMCIMSCFSTVITIMSLRVYAHEEEEPVPMYLRHIVAFINCRKFKKRFCKPKDPMEDEVDVDEHPDWFEDEGFKPPPEPEPVDLMEDITWKDVGEWLDFFLFLLFLGGTVLIAVFFLVPLVLAGVNN